MDEEGELEHLLPQRDVHPALVVDGLGGVVDDVVAAGEMDHEQGASGDDLVPAPVQAGTPASAKTRSMPPAEPLPDGQRIDRRGVVDEVAEHDNPAFMYSEWEENVPPSKQCPPPPCSPLAALHESESHEPPHVVAASDDLAKGRQVWLDPVETSGRRWPEAETRNDLVEDENHAVFRGHLLARRRYSLEAGGIRRRPGKARR